MPNKLVMFLLLLSVMSGDKVLQIFYITFSMLSVFHLHPVEHVVWLLIFSLSSRTFYAKGSNSILSILNEPSDQAGGFLFLVFFSLHGKGERKNLQINL